MKKTVVPAKGKKLSRSIEAALAELEAAALPYPTHHQVQFHSKESVGFHIDCYRKRVSGVAAYELAIDQDATVKAVYKRLDKIRMYLVWWLTGKTDIKITRDGTVDAAMFLLERGLSVERVGTLLLARTAAEKANSMLKQGA